MTGGGRKVALHLSYAGTRYHGWQRQKNALAVQQVLEDALSSLCESRVTLSGCGRTDAGVHARVYVASGTVETGVPIERLPLALNAALPGDIVVHRAFWVPDAFDARFSAVRKEYTYLIHNAPARDAFAADRAHFYSAPLDAQRMAQAAAHFVGRQDFAAMRSQGTPVKSTVRHVYTCDVRRRGVYIRIRVSADGFLYNMVRTIAGTLIYCGVGKLTPADVRDILHTGRREHAGPTAPPGGLYMTGVTYADQTLSCFFDGELI